MLKKIVYSNKSTNESLQEENTSYVFGLLRKV